MRRYAEIYSDTVRALQPPYLRIATDLRSKIEHGELRAGEQVPSAEKLAQQYEVNRSTARRALALLKEWGLTDTQPGWGTFVRHD
jgi:DNA-binding GntR family transcriptional regulator